MINRKENPISIYEDTARVSSRAKQTRTTSFFQSDSTEID